MYEFTGAFVCPYKIHTKFLSTCNLHYVVFTIARFHVMPIQGFNYQILDTYKKSVRTIF